MPNSEIPQKLLWVDLEMTGLDVQNDLILEIASEVTDFNLKTLDSYEARVKLNREEVVLRMQQNVWWRDFSANRDDFLNKLEQGKPLSEIQSDMITVIEKHFTDQPAILAGNSIHNDRNFIRHRMPDLELKLHYRMLDVSAWKVFMQGRYSLQYIKTDAHRAFDDIQASIAELQYYLDWFKQNGPEI